MTDQAHKNGGSGRQIGKANRPLSKLASLRPADLLRIEYVALPQARRWDENPKRHDLEAIAESIYRYGFQDPPKFDQALGALVFGNGRTEALLQAKAAGRDAPRGIAVGKDGEWYVPIVFGNDLASQ